jgi:hypothetical protein
MERNGMLFHDATAEVDRHIDALHTQRNEATQAILAARTASNSAEYMRGFLAVTRREADSEGSTATAEMNADGTVFRRNFTLNGRTGDWTLLPGGFAELQNPDGTTEAFQPNGEPV